MCEIAAVTVDGVRPLVWTNPRAAAAAATSSFALLMVELGTSRRADRHADVNDHVADRTTSQLFDVAAGTALTIGIVASWRLTRATIRRSRTSIALGTTLMTTALALSASARSELGRFHRNALTVHVGQVVVDAGPYRRVRHPLYTATGLAFVGIGAALGNWVSVAASVLPVAALVRRISVEEAMLREHLGEEYAIYMRRTDRLLPGVW